MSLVKIASLTEEEAIKFIENIRWKSGNPICPHCGHTDKVYALKGKSCRLGLYKCGSCRKQFTVKVGTVMQGTHLTMKQWLITFHLMSSSKKGISALQLKRELGIQYKSAWFLAHRIRAAMQESPLSNVLKGKVEVDETYIGGKKHGSKRGRGTKKTPVVAVISREGDMIAKSVKSVGSKTLYKVVQGSVDDRSTIYTDEWPGYRGIGRFFEGGHHTVRHSAKEYVRGDVHVNNAESFFALLKRGIHGIFHHVSVKHLDRYCNEFSFRWSNRKKDDYQRMITMIAGITGKRLLYKFNGGQDQIGMAYLVS